MGSDRRGVWCSDKEQQRRMTKAMTRNRNNGSGNTGNRRVYAIDLFCGAGGLTKGLENAGVQVRLGIDVDPACEFPLTANTKAKFLLKPIEEVSPEEIREAFPKRGLRLLAGCAPCQTFSTYYQKASKSDKRWRLLSKFSKLILELQPDLVTMENVPRLMEHNVFKRFVRDLNSSGYHVDYQAVNCADYGVPQLRQRLVLLASKLGPIHLVPPPVSDEGQKTVRQAIGELPPLEAGNVHMDDPLHQCSSLSPLNRRRIKASTPGGTWRDWRKGLVADCHKKETGKTYPSVYGRMCWDEPAPTITTQFFGFGNGRFGHPEQDRAISLREGAIIQSFPREYQFVPPGERISKKGVGRLIGNAVPVRLGEVIGESIFAHLAEVGKKSMKRAKGARNGG